MPTPDSEVEIGNPGGPCSHPQCPRRMGMEQLTDLDLGMGGAQQPCLKLDCPRQNKMP
ncbi:MAG: hypothetical protein J0H14_05775 [Alphaproteobacteria bacterium]|nr:hypothetical protein [Alphaproteobacteria bacterium]